MSLAIDLEECRERHGDTGMEPSIGIRIGILRVRNGACHHFANRNGLPQPCFERVNAQTREACLANDPVARLTRPR